MTEAIWKFPLKIEDEQIIQMPVGAELLSVQDQRGVLCLWAKVNPEIPPGQYLIHIYGTGHQHARIKGRYIGSVQQMGGALVWHVFEG